MTIRKQLEAMMESAARPADQSTGDKAPKKIEDDVTKQAGIGGSTSRKADKSGTLEAIPSPSIGDPAANIQHGKGTEVQGNTYGEGVESRIQAALAEASAFKVDMTSLKGLFESQDLSEEFQAQAVSIFEAAVTDIAKAHIGAMTEAAAAIIESEVDLATTALEEEVRATLATTVAEWAEDNKLAIETGYRTEIAESFMEGLKDLLESHYVDMPEAKVDMYESAIRKGQEILEDRDAQVANVVALEEEIATLRKSVVVEKVIAGVTSTQAEKLRSLSESIEFDTEESFSAKLSALRENYVGAAKTAEALTEDDVTTLTQEPVAALTEQADTRIAALASAIGRFNQR